MIQKLPCIIVKNSMAIIKITNDEIEDGELKVLSTVELPVQFSQTSKRVQNSEGVFLGLAGKVYLDVELYTGLEFSGLIAVNGSRDYDFKGKKLYNPDGSFHHVELEVYV